jgi:eukaryotic-like serine/threonine-protein kinase
MTSPVKEGDILAQKYRVESVLGEGGMGVVVSATHLALGQRVALKFLLPEASMQGDTVARFLREAQASVKMKGEHVARVTDVGTLDSGLPYMVMEYLEGADLGQVLASRGPLPIEEAVDYLLQACEAVAEAHSVGVIHRDLKPANLFLTRGADGLPCVKVLDFGISKIAPEAGAIDPAMTKSQDVIGSPFYMSPEQMRSSRAVDPRADIWSLGVILHELLTGDLPFQGENVTEICAAVLQSPPPALRDRRPDAPPALCSVVVRCLERDVEARFPSVAELASALFPFATGHGRSSADRAMRILTGTSLLPMTSSYAGELADPAWGTSAPAGRSRGSGWMVATTAVLTLALGSFAAHRYAPRPRAAPLPAASAAALQPQPRLGVTVILRPAAAEAASADLLAPAAPVAAPADDAPAPATRRSRWSPRRPAAVGPERPPAGAAATATAGSQSARSPVELLLPESVAPPRLGEPDVSR